MNTLSKRAAIVTVFAAGLVGCGDDGGLHQGRRRLVAGDTAHRHGRRAGRWRRDQIEEFARQVESSLAATRDRAGLGSRQAPSGRASGGVDRRSPGW